MKIKLTTLLVGLFCLCVAYAEDLTIEAGVTYDLPATTNYEKVVVHGTLNIPSGKTVTAKTLELGPDVGDVASVNVLGSSQRGLHVTTLNIGANGGTGKIVALSPDATHNTDGTAVVFVQYLNICANAAVGSDGMIDFAKMGPGTLDCQTIQNSSATGRARIFVHNSCIGWSQYWGATLLKGKFQIETYEITPGGGYGTCYIGSSYAPRPVNDGSVVMKLNGADVEFPGSQDANDNQYIQFSKGMEWYGVKNVILKNKRRVNLSSDNVFPWGTNMTGFVKFTGSANRISIGKTTQRFNSLISNLASDSAIIGTSGGNVIFGDDDTDGSLKGVIQNSLAVSKVGTGTFSITNQSSVGALSVAGGTLRIAATLSVTSLTVDSGATLEIDGVTVAPSTGIADVRGNLVLKNGGKLLSTYNVSENERIVGYGNSGLWEKTGAGRCILEDPVNMPSNVHIKAGSVSFTAGGYSCDLYKWNVTAWNNVGWLDEKNGFKNDMFYLGELAFVAPNGDRIGGQTISTAVIGTAPGDLAAGKASFAAGTTLMSAGGSGNAGNLFDKNQWPRVGVDSPLTTDDGGVTLYVRLPADSPAVSALNFAGAYGGCPKTWSLSASRDGGETWTILNSVANYTTEKDFASARWMGKDSDGYGNPVPKAFPLYSASTEWTHAGTQGMPSAMQIEVDAGAELDFGNVTGGQTIDCLTVDVQSGGGAINNAKIADTGLLLLKNVSDVRALAGTVVPVTLTSVVDAGKLHNWTVYADDASTRYHARYVGGRLKLIPPGLVVLFR